MLIDLNRPSSSGPSGLNVSKNLEAIRAVNLQSAKLLETYFSEFESNCTYFYLSEGKVSSYQLLNYFLEKFNQPATVYITTWGMTETAVRQLATRKQSGQIKELYFVFSEQTKVNKANEYQLALSIATSHKIMPCHAKIYLIKTHDYQVSIVTSANLNRNNKLESGTITGSLETLNFYTEFLNNKICK